MEKVFISSEKNGAMEIKNSALLLLHILVPSMIFILCFGYLTLNSILCSREMINLPILLKDFENCNEKHGRNAMCSSGLV